MIESATNRNSPPAYSPLTLAYIGDAVFELLARTYVLRKHGNTQTAKLHKKTAAIVNAAAQSRAYFLLQEFLREDEMDVLKRGRNARSYTTAKNASVSDYRHATGVEALIGYLYVTGQHRRIEELFEMMTGDDHGV
ncbi:MAG: ribonuclease III [Defluviitaleaceae bacterium]|nr:ribonuclease III [Defluviitaleaceae bacterium]